MSWQTQLDDYFASLDWVVGLVARTRPDQLDAPTPCEEYTVRSLVGHLIGTARRGTATVDSTAPRDTPHVVVNVPDENLSDAFHRAAGETRRSWAWVDGPDEIVRAPWASCTALEAARGFTVETLVHGWDLAVATGQDPELLAPVAQRALGHVVIPERLVGTMYAPPVEARADEGPTTRLARRLGREAVPPTSTAVAQDVVRRGASGTC